MKKLVVIFVVSFTLVGCGIDPVRISDGGAPLYSIDEFNSTEYSKIMTPAEKELMAMKVGSDRTGYVQFLEDEARKKFVKEFPILKPSDDAYSNLTSHNHNMRVGQALALGADFEPSTAGFLKDENGKPISVTGKVSYRTEEALIQGGASGLSSGAMMGMVSATSVNSSLNDVGMQLTSSGQTQIVANGMVTGLIGGFIAGGIHAGMANDAIAEISKAKSFGERVEGTTLLAAHVMGGAIPISFNGAMYTRTPAVDISEGLVKRIFVVIPDRKKFDGSQSIVFLSTVGMYRGEKYQEKYPNSSGWEYRITNINEVYLPLGSENTYESIAALRMKLNEKNITL